MRILRLSILAGLSFPTSFTTPANVEERVDAHARAMIAVVIPLYGCPANATHFEECRPALGRIDYKAWRKACNTAKALWQLEGECK